MNTIDSTTVPSATDAPCKAVGLVCEFLTNPLGLETRTPRLSWRLEDARQGARQTAYRLVASSSAEAATSAEATSAKASATKTTAVESAG